ncbi:TetR/AcrR family transcriptional regulator [Actinomycetota bacterium]
MASRIAERSRRTVGRPATAVLTRDRIAEEAVALVSESGYGAFTMTSLARRLGVAPSALYNHTRSKDEVTHWLQDRVMGLVVVPDFAELGWREGLSRWARSYREVFSRHTPLIPVIAVLPIAGSPRTQAMYEAVAAGLAEQGWPEELVAPAIVTLESLIFGAALDANAPADIFSPGAPGETAAFTRAVDAHVGAEPGRVAERTFDFGLQVVLDGFAARLP